jgi:hypothetical protein
VLQQSAGALARRLRERARPRRQQGDAVARDRAHHGVGRCEVLGHAPGVGARRAGLERHPGRSEEQRRGAVAVAGVEEVEAPPAGGRVALALEGGAHRRPQHVALGRERRLGQLVEERRRVGREEEDVAPLLVLVGVDQRRHREQRAQTGLGLGLCDCQPVAVEVEAIGVDARAHVAGVGVLIGEHDDDHAAQQRVIAAPGEVAQQAQVGVGAAGLVAVHRSGHPHDRGGVAGAARAAGAHGAQPRQGGAQAIGGQRRDDRVAQRPAPRAEAGDGGSDHGRRAAHGAHVGVDLP